MIVLSTSTDSLSCVTSAGTGGVYDVDTVCSYIDRVTSTGVVGAADRKLTNKASAATTDIVLETGDADKQRNVKSVNIRNAHATAATDILVQIDANGTMYEIHKATLLAGESLCYIENVGWFKLADTTRLERSFILENDSTHATAATFADIGGAGADALLCPMKSGVVYGVLACLHHINNATTTGSQFGYNIGAAPTVARFSTIDTVTASATASTHSAGSITARDTAITAQTTGSVAITMAIIAGFIQPSADGTFAMRATSENTVASGLIVKAGSWLRVFRQTG